MPNIIVTTGALSRAEIRDTVTDTAGRGVSRANVLVYDLTGAPATVYASRTGTIEVSQPLVTDQGNITGWLTEGTYTLAITLPDGTAYSQVTEILSASNVLARLASVGSGSTGTDPVAVQALINAALTPYQLSNTAATDAELATVRSELMGLIASSVSSDRNIARQSSSRGRLGQFANKVPVSSRMTSTNRNISNGTDTTCNAISVHKATTDIADLAVVYQNWDQGGSGGADAGPGNVVNVTMRLEYPAGTYTPISFGGVSSVATPFAAPNLSTTLSDSITFSEFIPAGAIYWIHTFVSVATGGKWCQPLLANAVTLANAPAQGIAFPWVTGEGHLRGVGLSDGSGAALVTPVTTGYMPGPSAIVSGSYGAARSVVHVGDSITNGTIGTRGVQQNFLQVALNDRAGFVCIARAGGATAEMTGVKSPQRIPHVAMGTNFVCSYGCNDMNAAGYSVAQMQAQWIRIWKLGSTRGARVFQTTILPWTTSTDGWTTLAGQTPYAFNAVRVPCNNWLRAGAPIIDGVAVAAGTSGAILAGNPGHPLTGVLEAADGFESSRDSGLIRVTPTTLIATTANGSNILTNVVGNAPNGIKVVGPGIPSDTTVVSGGGTSTLTLSKLATVDASNATVNLAFVGDGIHPTAYADQLIAANLNLDLLLSA